MIAARQIAFGKAAGGKPYKARLEYLESSGTQYIELDYLNASKLQIDFKSEARLVGRESDYISNQDNSTGRFVVGVISGLSIFAYSRYASNASDGNATVSAFSAGTEVEVSVLFDTTANRKTLIVNGTTSVSNKCTNISNNNVRVKVFAASDWTMEGYTGKMWYMRLIKDDVLWYDLIPVLDNDSIPCMYDEVSGEFFYNAGTGEFIAGPEITEE